MNDWFYAVGGERKGPVDEATLRQLASSGVAGPGTLIWTQGMSEWQKIEVARPDWIQRTPVSTGAPPVLQGPAMGSGPAVAAPRAFAGSSAGGGGADDRMNAAGPGGDETFEYAYAVEGRPDFCFLRVKIPGGQMLKVEASAMATMDTNLRMKTKLRGGLGRFLTGESIFLNEFTAEGGPGEIGIAPGPPGDMVHLNLRGNVVYLQNSAYVASTPGVTVESKWQGLVRGFFSGEALFLIRCSGQGDLWFNSYGAIIPIDVAGGFVVDTGFIVGFTEGLDYSVQMLGGMKSFFLSGEGFVCRFTGTGRVWIQTRQVRPFSWWVHPFRPVKNRG